MSDDDRHIIEDFVSDFADMMSGFLEDYESYSDSLARLETHVSDMGSDIKTFAKIVRDGNGQEPLMTRMATIEERVKKAEAVKHRWWEFALAAAPGVIAIMIAL